MRVFPLSNWTELDVWEYVRAEEHSRRAALFRQGAPGRRTRGHADHGRRRPPAAACRAKRRRCAACASARSAAIPLTGAIESDADTLEDIIDEMRASTTSERQGRLIDSDEVGVDGKEEARGIFLMIERRAARRRRRPTLRLLTCGSVDDGKSTLIGRLLYEQKLIFDDQLAALERDSKKYGTAGEDIDFALLVDGLEAEREQGITIDVAYRYFATASALLHRRRHARPRAIHPQHGDRRLERRSRDPAGRRAQGRARRRPTAMPSSCRCSASVTSCWRSTRSTSSATTRRRFATIVATSTSSPDSLGFQLDRRDPDLGARSATMSPRRAEHALVRRAARCSTISNASKSRRTAAHAPFRLPVQWVNRPHLDFRGFAGTVPSGARPARRRDRRRRLGPAERGHAHPRRRRRRRRGGGGRSGDADARRRDRHRARRRAGAPRQRARKSPTSSPRISSG